MPLPLILGIAAGVAALGGITEGINGAFKMAQANDTMQKAERINNESMQEFESLNKSTVEKMDSIGKLELKILDSFKTFSELFDRIHNKPEFKDYEIEGEEIPRYDGEKIKEVSVGAAVLLGGLGGAALGVAGGFAAAGGVTAAVMALGTASTGTAIASLSGAAATNATLAALGGGAIAAGGGGVALGTTILGASTLGVGLLVGGIIFTIAGSGVNAKANEALQQANENKAKADKICSYLRDLSSYADTFKSTLDSLNSVYTKHLQILDVLVNVSRKTDYLEFNDTEKQSLENTVMLVALLYKICQIKLVINSDNDEKTNEVNHEEIESAKKKADTLLSKIG